MSEVRDDILQSILDDLREIGLSDTANYIQGLEDSIADHKRLVRELDVAINGDGAAQQASLCDIVAQVRSQGLGFGRAKPRPIEEYTEDMGPVLWWEFPIVEAPYCGTPNDCGHTVELHTVADHEKDETCAARIYVGGWPGYHTHFTMIELPKTPNEAACPHNEGSETNMP